MSENSQTKMTVNVGESTFKTEVCVSTPVSQLAMSWINEVEMAKTLDDLMTPQSIQEQRDFSDFEMLDARIAFALRRIISSSSFRKMVSVAEQSAQKRKQILEKEAHWFS